MTMGRWMRDYVFYPLSLSKAFTNLSRKSRRLLGQFIGKRLPSFLAMFIVYLLVGFWHGSNWKYVAYGLWNGAIIMMSILLENVYRFGREKCGVREESFAWRVFRIVRTFVIVSFGRFFSGAGSFIVPEGQSLLRCRQVRPPEARLLGFSRASHGPTVS